MILNPTQIAEEFEKVALRESEQDDLEAAMLESIMRASRETYEQNQIQSQLEQMSICESRQDYYQAFTSSNSRARGSSNSSNDFCAAGGRSFNWLISIC